MVKQEKTALARRVSGNVYDVRYPGAADYDQAVSYDYLRELVRRGYRVTVDQSTARGEGEPKTFDVTLDD